MIRKGALRRAVKGLFSLEVFPFAVLIALSLISILSRLWLVLKPLAVSRPGW